MPNFASKSAERSSLSPWLLWKSVIVGMLVEASPLAASPNPGHIHVPGDRAVWCSPPPNKQIELVFTFAYPGAIQVERMGTGGERARGEAGVAPSADHPKYVDQHTLLNMFINIFC